MLFGLQRSFSCDSVINWKKLIITLSAFTIHCMYICKCIHTHTHTQMDNMGFSGALVAGCSLGPKLQHINHNMYFPHFQNTSSLFIKLI